MTVEQRSSGGEWCGMSLVARLQLAAGVLDLDRRSVDPILRSILDAVEAVDWIDVPCLEFVVARSVVARFLCEVASRQSLGGLPSTIVLRLESAFAERFSATVLDVATRFLGAYPTPTGARHVDERVQVALRMIRSHSERKLRIDDLARAVGLSRWHLERLTKQNTGTSPRQHLVAARMARAITLLEEGRFSVKELAFRLGYGNADAFTRDFRKFYGAPPRTWLRVHSKRKTGDIQMVGEQ